MASPDYQPVPASDEGTRRSLKEFVLGEDWGTRFFVNSAGMRALRVELDEATEPDDCLEHAAAKEAKADSPLTPTSLISL